MIRIRRRKQQSSSILFAQILWNGILVGIIFISILLSWNRYKSQDYEMFYNNARVLVAKQYKEIEKSFVSGESVAVEKAQIPYCIIDLSGKVLVSYDNHIYLAGQQVNLQEVLSYDNSFAMQHKNLTKFTLPLLKDKVTAGYVMFFLNSNEVWGSTKLERQIMIFKPVLIAIVIVAMLLFGQVIYLRRRIIKPMVEISESAQAIIEGNFDKQVVRTYSSCVKQDEVGKLLYAFELMRDELKERMLRENSLKQSQKELISCMSHDLKTPISTIKVYSEGIRDGIAKNPEKLKEYADVIARKTQVIAQMINDLLDHSNAELNELSIHKKDIYMKEYLLRIVKEITPYVNERGIAFSYDELSDNVLVSMDERRITQVIYNLIENAMKYMDKENGYIHMRAIYEVLEKRIKIEVEDNGSGISIEDIPYVFDRFYRGEKSRNMSIPGCGLGLSICKYIVQQHDGEIACKSRSKEGTLFWFTLQV